MKINVNALLFLACFFLSSTVNAQWSKIGITLGYDNDMVQGLSAQYIAGASNLDLTGVDISRFNNASLYSMACENPHVRLYSSYNLPQYKATTVNVGIVGIFNRWDDVAYYIDDTYFSFGSISHEIDIESTLDKRWDLWNVFYLDLGIGMNSGIGFGGSAYMNYYGESPESMLSNRSAADIVNANDISSTTTYWNQVDGSNKTSLHARAFGKLGVGIIFFDTIEIGAAMRYGVGMRKHIQGSYAGTHFVSMETNLAYRF